MHDFDSLKEGTMFMVEATSYERLALWRENDENNYVQWEQIAEGCSKQVGTIGKRPVVVSFNWALLDGRKVCFYHATSQMVDHEMIEEWIGANYPWPTHDKGRRAQTDAMNFGHCIAEIRGSKTRRTESTGRQAGGENGITRTGPGLTRHGIHPSRPPMGFKSPAPVQS